MDGHGKVTNPPAIFLYNERDARVIHVNEYYVGGGLRLSVVGGWVVGGGWCWPVVLCAYAPPFLRSCSESGISISESSLYRYTRQGGRCVSRRGRLTRCGCAMWFYSQLVGSLCTVESPGCIIASESDGVGAN